MSHTPTRLKISLSASHANKGLRGKSNSIGGREQEFVEHLENMQKGAWQRIKYKKNWLYTETRFVNSCKIKQA